MGMPQRSISNQGAKGFVLGILRDALRAALLGALAGAVAWATNMIPPGVGREALGWAWNFATSPRGSAAIIIGIVAITGWRMNSKLVQWMPERPIRPTSALALSRLMRREIGTVVDGQRLMPPHWIFRGWQQEKLHTPAREIPAAERNEILSRIITHVGGGGYDGHYIPPAGVRIYVDNGGGYFVMVHEKSMARVERLDDICRKAYESRVYWINGLTPAKHEKLDP